MSFDIQKAQQDIASAKGGLPPVDKWNPEFCGDIDMRIARDGRWYYMGSPIGRQAMVNLFARVLWKEGDNYFLKTPVEKVGIQVDDVPFLFIAVEEKTGEQGKELCFTSSTGDQVTAGRDFPLRVETDPENDEPSPYLYVRWGMEGLISRNVFYQLVELAEEREVDGRSVLVLESQGEVFELGAF